VRLGSTTTMRTATPALRERKLQRSPAAIISCYEKFQSELTKGDFGTRFFRAGWTGKPPRKMLPTLGVRERGF
jgi:hypothetical protein